MLLSCQNVQKAFHEKQVLKNCSFHIEDNEKAAVVGINGAGKTTLLRIIVGELEPDEGIVVFGKDRSFGYLPQNAGVEEGRTIYEELLEVKRDVLELEEQIRLTEKAMKDADSDQLEKLMEQYTSLTHRFEQADGYSCRSEITGVLKGLGFMEEEFGKQSSTLSGGEKTRVALGRLLLKKPDLIILDEPTNHLDMSSIAWLETYLLNYRGAVLIVSHDRYFLDKIASRVIEIDSTQVSVFSGNYSAYAEKKELIRSAALKAYWNQQQEIKHQEEVISKLKSFNREKSIRRAESREKMLQKIEVIEKPVETRDDMRIELTPRMESGNDVISVENLSKSFGSRQLFSDLNFSMKKGEHVSIIGDNGTGKTTVLKIINELIAADAGRILLGSKVHIGYYDQEHNVLHSEKTLFEEVSDDYPSLTNTEIRNILAAFLFTGDDVFKQIHMLSGGERGRVSLAKLMLSEANFLIMDEPTNHLDIMSKEILEDAVNSYSGTVLYVSHDRYFINRTASRILELYDGQFIEYLGNYDYYLEKKATLNPAAEHTAAAVPGWNRSSTAFEIPSSQQKTDWKAQKEALAAQRKKENALKRCEEAIEKLENRNREIEEEMLRPDICINVEMLQNLGMEKSENDDRLLELLDEWEELNEEE